jgi:UDP-N-acetylmuramoylalanine--D-glutamate ligase
VKVLVLGAAVSGIAAAHLARRLGDDVAVYDQSAHAVSRLRGEGFTLISGAWSGRALHDLDLVITSPGIPEGAAPIRSALEAGIPLISEMEFAARRIDVPYLAVTGTNGKTTVTEVTAAMLNASGIRACAAGNIGRALSDVVDEQCEAVVIEASSFQLRFSDTFHPVAAAITNVAPDHLDWHASEAEYARAKAKIFARMGADEVVAFDADDPGARALAELSTSKRVAVSGTSVSADGFGVRGSELVLGDFSLEAPDVGTPFLVDLALGAVLARTAGATPDAVAAVIGGFEPGPHRRTVIAEYGGVRYIDDSKATNPHAAVASVRSYPSVILIAGGRNKGLDLAPIAAVPELTYLIGLGEAAEELARHASASRFHHAADMDDAIAVAAARAQPGDVVLLAPGCASFDMYDSYAARGDAFAAAVRRLQGVA